MKLFHKFNSQEDRRNFGGSYFIELQFCRLPKGTENKKLFSDIRHWQNDSLYICDDDLFYREYSGIFNCGIYHNLKTGIVDIYGLNYYPPELTDALIKRITEKSPEDGNTLLEWLSKAKNYNGFYVLGV